MLLTKEKTMNITKKLYISILFTICCLIIFLLASTSANTVTNDDQIDILCSSVDCAINGITIKATMKMTFDKSHRNQHELEKQSYINNRRKSRNGIRPEQYEQKIIDTDFELVRDLVIENDGTNTLVRHQLHQNAVNNDPIEHILFYEPGKEHFISLRNRKTRQMKDSITNTAGPIDSFNNSTAYSYGRGLSLFISSKKVLKERSDDPNLFELKVYDAISNQLTASIILDKTRGYCWRNVQIIVNNKISAEYFASNFKKVNDVWLPFRLDVVSYSLEDDNKKWLQKRVEEIQEAFFPSDKKQLNVFDVVPANTEIYKRRTN